MADIIFKYPEIDDTVSKIRSIKAEYETACTSFITAMASATDTWEGASKEKFMEFINTSVKNYMGVSVPSAVEGIAALLSENGAQMMAADDEVAAALPSGL